MAAKPIWESAVRLPWGISQEASRLCFNAFHQDRRASRCTSVRYFSLTLSAASLDDKVVALIAALLLQGHELFRLLLRLGNA